MKAICVPSGDQCGSDAPPASEVSWVDSPPEEEIAKSCGKRPRNEVASATSESLSGAVTEAK